jgi:hypothetical protein
MGKHFFFLSSTRGLLCSSSHELLVLGISLRIFNAVVSPCLLHDCIRHAVGLLWMSYQVIAKVSNLHRTTQYRNTKRNMAGYCLIWYRLHCITQLHNMDSGGWDLRLSQRSWVLAPCVFAGWFWCFGETCYMGPEVGDSMFLWNIGIDLQIHRVPKPKTFTTAWIVVFVVCIYK